MSSEGGSDAEADAFNHELNKLKQKHRIMKADRTAYTIESQEQIRRQLREMELLESEKIEMEKKLALADNNYNQMLEESAQKKIELLIKEREKFNEQIVSEECSQEKLDKQISELKERVIDEKKKAGGSDKIENYMKSCEKQKKVLENRLHLVTEKFNKNCAENNKQRDVIEILRINKSNYLKKFRKHEKMLKGLRKDTSRVTEESTLAYEQRDEAHNKMFMLKDKCEKDIQLFNAEIRELQRVIDDDNKRREFMKNKETTRIAKHQATRKELDSKRIQEEKITSYEDAFKAIIDCSGKDDISSVVANFIQVEDKNFALFNLVNEQNNVIEQLNEDVKTIKQQISAFEREDAEMREDRKKIMVELEEELAEVNEQNSSNEQMLKQVQKVLAQLKIGTGSMFEKIGCDPADMTGLLGTEKLKVEDDSVMKYLGVIEQRANHILLSAAYVQSQTNFETYDPYEVAKTIVGHLPNQQRPLSVNPPSTADDTVEDSKSDDEIIPLTSEQLKMKVLATVQKKEADASKTQANFQLQNSIRVRR